MERTVFLFGAGSVLDWRGPTTSELTELVRKSGFNVCDSDVKITEYIYTHLIESGLSRIEVNFETIINVIEELIIFHSEFNSNVSIPSLLRCMIKDNSKIDELFNYSIKGGQQKHGYELQIPKGVDYPYSKQALNKENPDVYFLQHLLAEILTNIVAKVSEYSYSTKTYTKIDSESKESEFFIKWISHFKHSSVLRLYTLNYDRLFKVLLQKAGINCFEGFDIDSDPSQADIKTDIFRIVTDKLTNCHYNLHGSAWWYVKSEDWKGLNNYEIVYSGALEFPINNSFSVLSIQKGRPLLITNIITGYQKSEKLMLSPFRQMYSSFEYDCLFAEKLFIIGYSFNDEHVNECIKSALKHNQKIKIEIVDPCFISKIEEFFALHIFPYAHLNLLPKKIDDSLVIYNHGKIAIHTLTFKDYLSQFNNKLPEKEKFIIN